MPTFSKREFIALMVTEMICASFTRHLWGFQLNLDRNTVRRYLEAAAKSPAISIPASPNQSNQNPRCEKSKPGLVRGDARGAPTKALQPQVKRASKAVVVLDCLNPKRKVVRVKPAQSSPTDVPVQPEIAPARENFIRALGIEPWRRWRTTTALAGILALLLAIECFVPLRTAVQIGADEGIELAKATLCLNGHKLYSEIWNDQPPLHTFLVTEALRHVSPSVLTPRLITVGFAAVLITGLFVICVRVSGLLTAFLTSLLLIASPGFIELGSSCMLEIPALATAIAALCLLLVLPASKWRFAEVAAGIVFGLAVLMKLVPLILLPLAVIVVRLRDVKRGEPLLNSIISLLLLGVALAASFAATDLLIEKGAFLAHFQQSWSSHFGKAKSLDYGSAAEHPFPWSVFLKNWDTSLPALAGIGFLLTGLRKSPWMAFPLAWMAVSLLVFGIHKPWWPYYYIHLAIPLCWCAAAGIQMLLSHANPKRNRSVLALVCVFGLCALPWMAARVYLQVSEIRASPQTYYTTVLHQIERLKPSVRLMYADDPIYSFHAGIPMPPQLAVLPLKRFWAGEMSNERLVQELSSAKPSIILLRNDGREVPFEELLTADYRLVYLDPQFRLFSAKARSRLGERAK